MGEECTNTLSGHKKDNVNSDTVICSLFPIQHIANT